jgi:altronate dehydratase small subunit
MVERHAEADRVKPLRGILIHERDNVATAVATLAAGEEVTTKAGDRVVTVTLRADIPFGHKYAVESIPVNGVVIKYGEVIGSASAPISPGEYVHVHNVDGIKGRGDKAAGGSP